MLKISLVSLFPEVFKAYIKVGMLAKATTNRLVEFNLVDLRNFGLGKKNQVDDTPYGGGSGMILMIEPLVLALEAATSWHQSKPEVVLFTPGGELLTQAKAQSFAQSATGLILIGGRYEGYDERLANFVDSQISIGNYVLTGFELPALVFVDTLVRLKTGVLGNPQSLQRESFSDDKNMIEHPQYTKPADFRGLKVPEVLQSGNHQLIEKWRQDNSGRSSN